MIIITVNRITTETRLATKRTSCIPLPGIATGSNRMELVGTHVIEIRYGGSSDGVLKDGEGKEHTLFADLLSVARFPCAAGSRPLRVSCCRTEFSFGRQSNDRKGNLSRKRRDDPVPVRQASA